MSRERARSVVERLGIPVLASDGNGIEIKRVLGVATGHFQTYEPQRWRVMTGGGIAGNSNEMWLRKIGGFVEPARGPFKTKRQLEHALRAWRRGE